MVTSAESSGAPRGSLCGRAYDTLRRRIVEGELQPGQRLVERDLAAELEVSRIPLREALRLLEADGLVVLVPRRGALVAPFAPADVRHLFDVRESLEALAARLAAGRTGPAGLARLAAR
ncbi:GntR family transcriptional regulator, partial [Streptomyces sp. CRN 30]|uniref:GntR family transcriptional regulator n=1 Tax=Streptomyces sp. CRN 30 TaxID=3075613 RepID=UPI002A81830A